MGCDIHLYIEYKSKNTENEYWWGFGGRYNPGRNYAIFGLMAKGVRCEFPESFPIKGLPNVLGYKSKSDNLLYICEEEGEGNCKLRDAWRWHESGASKIIFHNEQPTWVTNPDWHSHSWLSADEFQSVWDNYIKIARANGYGDEEPEWEAVNVLLQHFKNKGYEARIVFWFDN
jgi:hypothetical protein